VIYAGAYETVEATLTDLDAIEQLHKKEMIGQYDAAVIDKEDGKPPRGQADGPVAHPGHPGVVRRRDPAPQGAPRGG
jgi:hypothetical protein